MNIYKLLAYALLFVSVAVSGEAVLSITHKAQPDLVFAGTPLIYTITAVNKGTSVAKAVTVTQITPVSTLQISAASSQGICDATVKCDVGDLQPGQTVTINIVVSPQVAGTVVARTVVTPGNKVGEVTTTALPPMLPPYNPPPK